MVIGNFASYGDVIGNFASPEIERGPSDVCPDRQPDDAVRLPAALVNWS